MVSQPMSYWRMAVIIISPIVLLPILLWQEDGRMVRCAYVVAVMAAYWITEAVPLTVTALVPLFAFPLLGVQTAAAASASYVKDVSFLFIGGLLIGVAVEKTNLHTRIALLVLRAMGSEPRWLMLGVMIATAVLSMFISNTATTAMMVPIVMTICREMIKERRQRSPAPSAAFALDADRRVHPVHVHDDTAAAAAAAADTIVISRSTLSAVELNLCKAMLLATCYSASLGGTATLTGTPPNIIMAGLLTKRYDSHPVNYLTWLCYNGPGMILNITVAWTWLQLMLLGGPRSLLCRPTATTGRAGARQALDDKLRELGAVSWAQASVFGIFVLLFVGWISRSPLWGDWFLFGADKSFVSDGTTAMFFASLLFVWPKQPFGSGAHYEPILSWREAEAGLAWGIVLLLGGGFAVGDAVRASGLSELIGQQLFGLPVSRGVLCVLSLVLMTYTTEFTSNTATASIILPIMMELAERRCINPLYLTLPVSEAASFAYMLPVATPPNAIIFGAGVLRVRDMMALGFFMNVACMLEVLLSIHTWGWAMFQLGQYPVWAGNNTACL